MQLGLRGGARTGLQPAGPSSDRPRLTTALCLMTVKSNKRFEV